MKRTIITVLLVMSLSFLIALESDPSETVGFVKYDLVNNGTSGYNIIAVPLGSDMIGACSTLYAAIPNCDGISMWDATGQFWVNYDGQPWTPTYDIESGYSYMAHVTANDSWYSTGSLQTPPVFTLVNNGTSGYNMIMIPLNKSGLTDSSLLFNDIPNCDGVSKWDATGQFWVNYDGQPWTPTFNTAIGGGYNIHVTANGTWPTARLFQKRLNKQINSIRK